MKLGVCFLNLLLSIHQSLGPGSLLNFIIKKLDVKTVLQECGEQLGESKGNRDRVLIGLSESTTQGRYYHLAAKVIPREGKDTAYSQKTKMKKCPKP